MSLPTDVINIILEYYSQLREKDMKWTPFIETTTGKLKWKVNKHSTKYDNIKQTLRHHLMFPPRKLMTDTYIVNYYNYQYIIR